jgi:hypothetical protein
MAFTVKHKRSDEEGRRPRPESLFEGQLALNNSDASPSVFLKTDKEKIVKIGPCHVGSIQPKTVYHNEFGVGEMWLDITNDINKLKVWDGQVWRTVS